MFTGLVDHCGQLVGLVRDDISIQLWISSQFHDLQLGESICVDGVCLTVAEIKSNTFRCDVSPETLRLTNFNHYVDGQLINLERALRYSDRIGGHFVTGHVDQTAVVKSIVHKDEFTEIVFNKISPYGAKLLVKKGSITLNGVSLTINKVSSDSLAVMLIPHTLKRTNLGHLQTGDRVNVEFDCLSKMVAKQVQTIKHREETA